jgi:hypothetical protein
VLYSSLCVVYVNIVQTNKQLLILKFVVSISSLYICIIRQKAMKKRDLVIILACILVIGVLRLFIPIPNFSPIGAIALTGGFILGKNKWSYLLPMGGLLISDLVLGMTSQINFDYLFSLSFLMVYVAFAITILLGIYAKKRNSNSGLGLLPFAVLSSVIFFLITNFGAWLYDPIYTKNLSGLISSYIAGLAFYKQAIFGNMALNHLIATSFFTVLFSWYWSKFTQLSAKKTVIVEFVKK